VIKLQAASFQSQRRKKGQSRWRVFFIQLESKVEISHWVFQTQLQRGLRSVGRVGGCVGLCPPRFMMSTLSPGKIHETQEVQNTKQ
jgi:hypothetical protein